MTMKTISVAELKTHLSRVLRRVGRGERVIVTSRGEAVAELGPPSRAVAGDPYERMAREGRIRLGTQDWATLKITPLARKIDIQRVLDEVREDVV
jgi:prevent-host-death family protein